MIAPLSVADIDAPVSAAPVKITTLNMPPPFKIPILLLAFVLVLPLVSSGIQTTYIDVNATVSAVPLPQVAFTWDTQKTGVTVNIYRRMMGVSGGDATWELRGSAGYPATTFTDEIVAGLTYEYKIHRPYLDLQAPEVSSFVAVTLQAPLVQNRGKLLLVVDNTMATPLANELRLLEMDLVGDGWTVQRIDSARHGTGTPAALRSAIQAAYNADPTNTKAVYLFGHLPVAKSGYTAPDGHSPLPQHTDGFYGDMDGNWTDSITNIDTSGTYLQQPGDGIYDQDTYPSPVDLMVGRVDFADMTAYHKNEIEYLRDYIHKSHAFRCGQRTEVTRRGIWNSSYIWQERNWINPLFGTANITLAPFQPTLATNPYLFGVDFSNNDGTSSSFYTDTANKLIFGINFGSGKLYWANSNNAMRGLLAQPDWGLTCAWGSRPSYFFHHMGAGYPVGYSIQRTMNNRGGGSSATMDYYPAGDNPGMAAYVHISLMGDPTLRLHPVTPPASAAVTKQGADALVSWEASPDPAIAGYYVYSSTNRLGPYTLLNSSAITGTTFTHNSPPSGDVYYQVRALKTETTPAAIYANTSQGVFARLNANGTTNHAPTAQSGTLAGAGNLYTPVTLSGSDPDGDTLIPVILTNPRNGELRWNGYQILYTPKTGFSGGDSIVYSMSDGVAMSTPATISITASVAPSLAEWEFGSPSAGVAQNLNSTGNAAGIPPSAITFGSAMSMRYDFTPFTDDGLSFNSAPTGGLNANGYIQWVIQPSVNRQIRFSGVSFGLWIYHSSRPLSAELRWSNDGFSTWHNVPLGTTQIANFTGGSTFANGGMPFGGDLSAFSELQGTTKPITFRLYLWFTGTVSNPGIGKLGASRPDLVVSGTVEPLSFESWTAGVNWQGKDSSKSADPDGDQVPNGIEFVLARNPMQAESSLCSAMSVVTETSGSYLTLDYRRRTLVSPPVAQTSTDLVNWINRTVDGTNLIEEVLVADPLGDGSVQDVRLKLLLPPGQNKEFLRLLAP